MQQAQPDVVFHTVSPQDNAPDELSRNVNIRGTTNVIDACRELGIPHLVFTSSFAVVVAELREMVDIDETWPYSSSPTTGYAESKIAAEKMVLAANGHGISTVALRPLGITGPGDRQFIKGVIDVYHEGNSWVQVGDGHNYLAQIDVRDLANAHLLAAEKLVTSPQGVAGEYFFVTGPEHLRFWEGARLIWKMYADHTPRFTIKLPVFLAYWVAAIFEFFGWLLSKPVAMNRRNIIFAANTFTMKTTKARERLDFIPQISIRDSLRDTVEHYKEEEARRQKKT